MSFAQTLDHAWWLASRSAGVVAYLLLSVAVILDQASYLFPAGEPGRASLQTSSQVVTMLNWAMSPHVKRLNMAFVLVDEKLADLSDRVSGNPHVATIEVPLPTEQERAAFVQSSPGAAAIADFSDFDTAQLATLTAGMSLADLNVLVQSARENGKLGGRPKGSKNKPKPQTTR